MSAILLFYRFFTPYLTLYDNVRTSNKMNMMRGDLFISDTYAVDILTYQFFINSDMYRGYSYKDIVHQLIYDQRYIRSFSGIGLRHNNS